MPTCLAIHITVSYHLLFVFDFTLSYAIPEFWLKRDEEGLKKKQICVIKLNSWGLEQYLLTECVLNHWYLSWYLSSFRKTSVFLGQLSAFFLFISIFLSCDAPCAYRQHALLYVTLLFYLYRKYANLLSRFLPEIKITKITWLHMAPWIFRFWLWLTFYLVAKQIVIFFHNQLQHETNHDQFNFLWPWKNSKLFLFNYIYFWLHGT